MAMDERWLTVDDMCKYLNVSWEGNSEQQHKSTDVGV
jgi:hypothetical protein